MRDLNEFFTFLVFEKKKKSLSRDDITGQLGLIWELIKAPLIVPAWQLGVYVA